MRIAFYKAKNGTWQDKSISLVTGSQYSHCELVFSDGMCASSSARDGGVRMKHIDLGEKWDVYTLLGKYDEDVIRYWFETHKDNKYNWLGAIGSVVDVDIGNEDKKFCSYCCALMVGINPIITPGKLFRTLALERMI